MYFLLFRTERTKHYYFLSIILSSSSFSPFSLSSSSRSSSSRSAPSPPRKPAAAPTAVAKAPAAPAPAVHAPPASGGGLMGTIMEGMAFGTGSAIAHRVVGAVAGSVMGGSGSSAPAEAAAPPASAATFARQDCSEFQREFTACLAQNKSDIAACQHIMENLNACHADARLR